VLLQPQGLDADLPVSSDHQSMQKIAHTLCILFVSVGLFATDPLTADDRHVADSAFRVVGYLPDYRVATYDLGAAAGLTDLIVFSAEPAIDGQLNTGRLQNCPWPTLLAFKTKHRVRLLLTIGGWERSTHFAAVASSQELRAKFVAAVVEFCLAKRLDGVDLDWEHPEGGQQEQGYALLLNDLRKSFDTHGLLLSVTMAAWQKLAPEAIAAVHYVQVMAYDHDQRHSTFDAAKKDVDQLRDMKIPAEKIILGLPFYGRDLKSRDAMTYAEIQKQHKPKSDQDEIEGMYFNGPETILRKTQYAIHSGLGGVMVWELGQDAPGDASLLKVIQQAVD
jgi:chitinase